LLIKPDTTVIADAELVPANAAAARCGIDRMHGDDRLLAADAPIHDAGHDLVALRVEPALDSRLRNAIRELAVAEILIRRNANGSRFSHPRR
jgi:hypothetical protein